MSQDKIEGVSKISETHKTQAGESAEQTGSEHFRNLMNSNSSIHTAFERVDPKNLAITGIDTQNIETPQTQLPDEDVSSHKMGSATDQEQKKQQNQSGSDSDEVEGVSGVEKTKNKLSSFEIENAHSPSASKQISIEDIKKQTNEIVSKLEGAKTQLAKANQDDLEIKPSYQKLLRNHLTHIDDNIKIASSKVGVESTGEVKAIEGKGSLVERFLNMITHSQHEINNLEKNIEVTAANEMNSGQMLALQIKMGLVSHEIELFANLLNKALEATKTIMNVQV